jgi:hypothetical protein
MKNLFLLLLKKVGVSLSGPIGWLVSLFVDKIAVWVQEMIRRTIVNIKEKFRAKKDEKNEQKYQEVLNSDNKTEQDIDNATDDLLNGK